MAILLIFWYLLAIGLKTPALPAPWAALTSFQKLFVSDLLPHLTVSFYRVVISLTIATLLGAPLGLWLGKNQKADEFSAPLIYITYPVPKVVFLPIFLILLGIGDASKIVLITLTIFYIILVTTRDAARNIPKEYILSVQSLKANRFALYRHVYFPACLPAILTSLRLGLGIAMSVLFLVETYATQEGIGFFIMNSWSSLAYNNMFAGSIAMGLMGFLLYLFLDACERVLCSWVHL